MGYLYLGQRYSSFPRLSLLPLLTNALLVPLLTNALPGPSASEVTSLWRYTNMFIIIIFFIPQVVKIPEV